MATRLYMPSACAAVVNAAVNGSYNYVSELVFRHLATCKTGTVLADGVRVGPWTVGQTAVGECLVSPPLSGPGTLSGTWQAQLRSREYASGDDAYTAPEIYVVSNDGSTVRGTAWAIGAAGPATELNTANRNKTWADGDTLTSVNWQDDDRIAVKLGFSNPGTGSTPEASNNYGDNFTNSDLPVDETQTTAGIGWIEFSQDITFKAVGINRLDQGEQLCLSPTPLSTASISPTAGRPVVLLLFQLATGTPTLPDPPTTNNLTWTYINSATYFDAVGQRVSAYIGVGDAPTAGSVEVNFAEDTYAIYHLVELPGGGEVAQSAVNSSDVATAPLTATFGSAGTANSAILAMFTLSTTPAGMAPTAGVGQVYVTNSATGGVDALSVFSQVFRASVTEVDGDGGPRGRGVVAIEIAPAAAPAADVVGDQLGMSGVIGV